MHSLFKFGFQTPMVNHAIFLSFYSFTVATVLVAFLSNASCFSTIPTCSVYPISVKANRSCKIIPCKGMDWVQCSWAIDLADFVGSVSVLPADWLGSFSLLFSRKTQYLPWKNRDIFGVARGQVHPELNS